MSQGNVELVRAVNESVLRAQGDGEIEALLKLVNEPPWSDMTWDAREVERLGFSDLSGVHRPPDGGQQFWRGWLEAWDALVFDYELREAGDSVVSLMDMTMRGRSTGIEVEAGKHAHIWDFEGGRPVGWRFYVSQAEALEAAGLSE